MRAVTAVLPVPVVRWPEHSSPAALEGRQRKSAGGRRGDGSVGGCGICKFASVATFDKQCHRLCCVCLFMVLCVDYLLSLASHGRYHRAHQQRVGGMGVVQWQRERAPLPAHHSLQLLLLGLGFGLPLCSAAVLPEWSGNCERRVATGVQHSCVIVGSSYAAVCSGNDASGTGKLAPPTEGWQSITAGDDFTCGLSFDGAATCWGALPSTLTTSGSYAITGRYLDGAAGGRHWCGIAWNGSAICLGDCSSGVCAPPPGLQLVHTSSGSDYACGVTAAGRVVCWGGAISGVPAAMPLIVNAVRVAAGGGHACALLADGSAMCWGANDWGQAVPPLGATFTALAAGAGATCGIMLGGGVTCWGNALTRAIPSQFADASVVAVEISCAALQCCGLAVTGDTLCWLLAPGPATTSTLSRDVSRLLGSGSSSSGSMLPDMKTMPCPAPSSSCATATQRSSQLRAVEEMAHRILQGSSNSYSQTTTPTAALTITATPTPTKTPTWTPTITPSVSRTSTTTQTTTPSRTQTPSQTLSGTPSRTPSLSQTANATKTGTQTPSQTPTATKTPTGTRTPTPSWTRNFTQSWTPSLSESRTASSTLTLSPTGTRTSTPTRTGTRTLSPSKTNTQTSSASRTPTSSLTPSPTTPPMTLVRVLPGPSPPPSADALGTLWLVGQAFRSGDAGPTLSTSPPDVIASMTVINSTHLQLTCNATIWYWSTALLVVTQIGYNASVTKPLYANLSLVAFATPNASAVVRTIVIPYGTPLQLVAPLLGAAAATRIMLQPPAPVAPFACNSVRAINDNVTECTPWLMNNGALGVPQTLSLLLSVGTSTIALPPSLAVTITRPTLTLFRNGAAVVPATGKATIHAGLAPATARLLCDDTVWAMSELQPPAACRTGGRTWQRAGGGGAVRNNSNNSNWAFALPAAVGGAAPAELHYNGNSSTIHLRVALPVGTAHMSLAAPATTPYAAATVQLVSPAVMAAVGCDGVGLTGTTCAPPATIRLAGAALGYANGVARIANVTLAGVPCSCVPSPSAPQTVATCAWPGALLDSAIAAAAPNADVISLPLSYVAAGATGMAPAMLPGAITVVIRPRLAAVIPSLVQAGTQIAVAFRSSSGGSKVSAVNVTVAGVPCTNFSAIAQGIVTCTAPVLSPPPLGYPIVAVDVVGASGLGAANTVYMSYMSGLTLEWVGTPPTADNATVVLPSGRVAGTLQPWPAEPPTKRVSGVGSGSCWVEAVTVVLASSAPAWACAATGSNCTNTTSWVVSDRDVTAALTLALVGTPTAHVALDGGAPSADVTFAAVGVTGGSGAAAVLMGRCVDTRGAAKTTSAQYHVALPSLAAAWDASSATLLAAPLPPDVMDASAVATVAWVGIAGNASAPPYSNASRHMSCTAAVYPARAGTVPPGLGLAAFLVAVAATDATFWSSTVGAVVEPGCDPAALPPDAPPALCWRAAFGALSLAAAPLGVNVTLAAECEWVPTGERVQLPALHGVVVTASVAWSLPAASSAVMDTPAATTAAIVHNASPERWEVATPSCHLAVRSGDARLTARAAAADYGADSSGIVTPAVSVEVTGLPRMTMSIVLACRVWGVAVQSSERSIVIQQLHLVPVRLPTTYLPSDGTTALLLDPPPSLRLLDDDGAGVDGVTCSLAAASNGAEVRDIGGGVTQAVSAAGGWLNFTAAVVVSSFSVPSAALVVACTRSTPDAPEPVAWTAALTSLTLDVCTPLAPVTDASNGVPPWHIGIAVDGVSPCSQAQHPVRPDIIPPTARPHVACDVTPVFARRCRQHYRWRRLPAVCGWWLGERHSS